MNIIRSAALLAALALAPVAAPTAQALTVASLTELKSAPTPAAFSLGAALVPGRPSRLDRIDADAAHAAARDYFDFDALVTFGALALAGGALAAFGAGRARAKAKSPAVAAEGNGDWHESVFQALQADLTEFTRPYHRAA